MSISAVSISFALQVDVAVTARRALTRMHHGRYGYVLIGLFHPFSLAWYLAAVAHLRNSRAVIIFIMNGEDQPFVQGPSLHYVKCHTLVFYTNREKLPSSGLRRAI
jgi:hypothetical protein